ncbi:MAG: C40 family peptidase [Lachnospiraceae bacterium]|nr:C40 family peptidase [Lachnospiraceae bacterium]
MRIKSTDRRNGFHQRRKRYDDTADSLTVALYPLGVPYYFGGHNENKILQVFYPLQESRYFKSDRKYLCGFDCAGYTNWCLRQAGLQEHPDLDSVLARGSDSFCLDRDHPETWPYYCLPGDIITVTHGYDHVMIYLGTLRTLGFSSNEVGNAEEYMDYPLVIHCGSNPFYYDRYAEYLKEKGERSITPTDGGVTVSIVMKDISLAPGTKKAVWGTTYGYFDVGKTPLLVFPLKDCTDFAWYGTEP